MGIEQLLSHKPSLHDNHTMPVRIRFINAMPRKNLTILSAKESQLFVANRLKSRSGLLPLLNPLSGE
jgi:hypothetical protein